MVIWITGLSGAGKTTLSNNIAKHYRYNNLPVLQMDGDELRKILDFQNTGYDRETRIKIGHIYSRMAKSISDQGFIVIVSVIGLFKEIFEQNRSILSPYFEIFLDTPMEELELRNSKKLYGKKAKKKSVVGVDLEPEFPPQPNMHIKFDPQLTPEEVAEICIEEIDKHLHPHSKINAPAQIASE